MGRLSAIYGWYNNQWRKAGLPKNISGSVEEIVSELNATAGNNTLSGTVVPTNEIWLIPVVAARDVNTNPTAIIFFVNTGTNTIALQRTNTPGALIWVTLNAELVLFPGWKIQVQFQGCTLNDDIIFNYIGHKIAILD